MLVLNNRRVLLVYCGMGTLMSSTRHILWCSEIKDDHLETFLIVLICFIVLSFTIFSLKKKNVILRVFQYSNSCLEWTRTLKDAKIGYGLRTTVILVFVGKSQHLAWWYIRDRSKHP